MGPLRRVNPYYKRYQGRASLLFTVVSLNVFIYHVDVISSYFKASYQSFHRTETCNYSFHLNISFIAVHSSDSFTLSFFFFLVLPWHVKLSRTPDDPCSLSAVPWHWCVHCMQYRAVTYIAQFSRWCWQCFRAHNPFLFITFWARS